MHKVAVSAHGIHVWAHKVAVSAHRIHVSVDRICVWVGKVAVSADRTHVWADRITVSAGIYYPLSHTITNCAHTSCRQAHIFMPRLGRTKNNLENTPHTDNKKADSSGTNQQLASVAASNTYQLPAKTPFFTFAF